MAQRELRLQYMAATKAELRCERAAFWKWFVEHGRAKL
jgi:hypothetical protein